MPSIQPHKQEKYHCLVQHLQEQIRSGELKAGDQLPTFAEFQSSFGVTSQTVSRALAALEHKGLISRQRGRGVFVAEQTTNSQLFARRQGIIGLCGWGFGFHWGSSSYWTQLLKGIRDQVQANGSQILLLEDDVRKGWEKVDGVLLADRQRFAFLCSVPLELPMVCLFSEYPNRASVVADESLGIRLAVEHLLALGHQRIAYLYDPTVPNRLKSYHDALRDAGITPQEDWRYALSGENASDLQFNFAGQRDMSAWLREGWSTLDCTALLCHNDDVAIGAMQSLNKAGLKVPQDVSVIGFDGTEAGEYSSPQLTTVQMPLQRMGEIAIGLLQKQIADDEVTVIHEVLTTHLRVRQSTAPLF